MAYIYKIINDINQKIYIGKTLQSIEKRWKEHQSKARCGQYENRPLYKAMNKYGIEHFHIELIEETNNPEERERFWIEYYGSFKYGYNATIGGDGRPYIDRDIVVATYQELQKIKSVAEKLKIDPETIHNILTEKKIIIKSSNEISRIQFSKSINQYSLDNNYLQTFSSGMDAARYIAQIKYNDINKAKGIQSHILQVCNNKRKTAYGYIWTFS